MLSFLSSASVCVETLGGNSATETGSSVHISFKMLTIIIGIVALGLILIFSFHLKILDNYF